MIISVHRITLPGSTQVSHLSALRSAVSANIRVLFQRQNNQEELARISQNMQRYKRLFPFFFLTGQLKNVSLS